MQSAYICQNHNAFAQQQPSKLFHLADRYVFDTQCETMRSLEGGGGVDSQ